MRRRINKELQEYKLSIILTKLKTQCLQWIGHLARLDDKQYVKKYLKEVTKKEAEQERNG